MESKTKFLPNNLYLPLFMLTRRGLNHNQLRHYFHWNCGRHIKNCRLENNLKNETETIRKLREKGQGYVDNKKTECDHHNLKDKPRTVYKHLSWQMPPNIYSVSDEPFKYRKGSSGAYWCKLPKAYKSKTSSASANRYAVAPVTSKSTDKYNQICNKHKGMFLGNARDHRPTDRCMVNSIAGCYKPPEHPGPNYYKVRDDHWVPARKWHSGSEYIFYKASIVPVKRNAIHSIHLSFAPGPGRYETRFPKACPCPRNRVFYANLTRAIEQQRLARALGLPHRRFNPLKYCSHEWADVVGHGHCHLFKLSKSLQKEETKKKERDKKTKSSTVSSLRRITALNVIKYMSNVYSTKPKVKSMPKDNFGKYNVSIQFNSLRKIKIRRPVRRRKRRIAFGSGITRFQNESRRLSVHALIKSRISLFKTRRATADLLHIIKKSTIKSRLYDIPKYLKPQYQPELRKRLFKFLPLPQPKILLDNDDICSVNFPKNYSFYTKPIHPKDYLKPGVSLSEDYKKMLDKYTKTKLMKQKN